MATKLSVLSYPIQTVNLKKVYKTEEDKNDMIDQHMEDPNIYMKSKNILPEQLIINNSVDPSIGNKLVLGTIAMNQQILQPSKKRRVSDSSSSISGSSTKVKQPQAVAVARRNARERNRVKQVNNGFAALREKIPEDIAENYENAGRNSGKKLSKVETLRMAVEYIRVLEGMLNLDATRDILSGHNTLNFSSFSSNVSESSLPATPPPEQPTFYAIKPRQTDFSGINQDAETQITIINGLQYVRIPGTDTFQLINPKSHFENEENIHPSDNFMQTSITTETSFHQILSNTIAENISKQSTDILNSSSLQFININDPNNTTTTTLIQEPPLRLITPAESTALSSYNGHSSLSPASTQNNINNNNNNMIIMKPKLENISSAEYETVKNQFRSTTNFPRTILLQNSTDDSNDGNYEHVILKEEINDDSIFDENSLGSEHMIKTINWWQQE